MRTSKSRKIALIIAVTMLILAFSTTGFAAYLTKTIKANYRNITVFVNGQQKNLNSEPFIIDGTTYVPLRDLAEILGSRVAFNPANYRIDIIETSNTGLQSEIYIKDARIKELEAKLKEKEEDSDKSLSISDLEDKLKKDYDKLEDVTIEDIDLYLSRGDIEVEIYIDTSSSRQSGYWDDLRDRDIERYLQKIVDDIHKEYKDADISGYIEDENTDKKVKEFYIDRNKKVQLGNSKGSADLEVDLNKEYGRYEGLRFKIDIKDNRYGDVEVDIDVTSGKLSSLSNRNIERYLEGVCEYIEDEYYDYDDYIFGTLDDEDSGNQKIDFTYDGGRLRWNFK